MEHMKATQSLNNEKFKILKHLPICTVVLHDIILNPELIPQIYRGHLLRKPLKLLKPSSSSCVNTSKRSNNIQLKEKVQKQNTVEKENYILTRSHFKKRTQRNIGGRNRNNKTQVDLETNQESSSSDQCETIQPKRGRRKQRVISNSSNELFAIKNSKSSDISTYCSHECCNIETSTKKKKSRLTCKKILYCDESDVANGDTSVESVKVGPDDTNCLDKRNLTFVNYNRKMEGIFTESITHMECNNNLHPTDVTNETNHVVRQKQSKKKQNKKDVSLSVVNTELSNKIYKYMNTLTKANENINGDAKSKNLYLSNNVSPTCNDKDEQNKTQQNQQKAKTNSKNKTTTVNSTVPKIIGNNILPKGTIKIINKNKTNISSQNSAFINILKPSDSLLTLNNNMNEEDKNNGLCNKIINHHNLNSLKKSKKSTCSDVDMFDADNEKTVIYENFVSCQKQSSGLSTDEILESKSQGSCSTEINYNEDTLNKNTSNLMNKNENCDTNVNQIDTKLNLIRKERAVNKNLKRTAEEDADFNCNQKKKLNRNSWMEYNGTLIKPINQQCNDLINTDMIATAQPNIVSKDEELNCKQDNDLRNQLNLKRSKRTNIQELTFERECNNKDSTELVEQINVENKNDTIMTKEQTKEYHKKLSVEKEPTLNETCCEEENNTQVNSHHDSHNSPNMIQNTEKTMNKNTKEQHINDIDNGEDGDCIFLFTDESFDESLSEDPISHKKNEPHKSLDSNEPYKMSANSFDKYVKQNKCEFNQEYAKCRNDIENNAEMSKSSEAKELSNKWEKTLCTNYIPRIATKVTPPIIGNIDQTYDKVKSVVNGYCFSTLRNGICCWPLCKFNHNFQYLIKGICLNEPRTIFETLQNVSATNFNFFCEQMYITSLTKLSVEQILMIYTMLCDYNLKRENFTLSIKCIRHIVMELLNREVSLKTIVKRLVEYMPVKSAEKINNILSCVDEHVKVGEYWNTVKVLILQPSFQPTKHTIEKILKECITYENLMNIQDVNDILIDKLHPTLMSALDKHLVECFKNLTKKTMKNSPLPLIQNFGENSAAENIASPDSNADETLLQVETPKKYDIIAVTSSDVNTSYMIQRIDNLPDPRSIYRDHERLWKFYMDLERLKKGLAHKDYDYVIDILKSYKEKEDENHFFIQSCCNIFRTEIKHSEYHVANIIRRTVQTGTCGILSETLFNIGLNILVSLINKEAWGLALSLIPSLNIYDLLHNAEFFLLSAEVYLGNKKTIEAFDLLKYKNIICTSRAKWHVKSTINDELVRNKIMYILLDSFCNECFEHAFFLFQFLLKDQSSQYYPIGKIKFLYVHIFVVYYFIICFIIYL
ncbi:putative histone-lysine N-methyltransferase 1 isoform X2 [Linepithema humile]|uniref:putative histone-lysine N-methyltransferase 1 isoform X2 n=1 Tax=Linepithema humile TaxID=83485 RepID=UPI00351E4F7D